MITDPNCPSTDRERPDCATGPTSRSHFVAAEPAGLRRTTQRWRTDSSG